MSITKAKLGQTFEVTLIEDSEGLHTKETLNHKRGVLADRSKNSGVRAGDRERLLPFIVKLAKTYSQNQDPLRDRLLDLTAVPAFTKQLEIP